MLARKVSRRHGSSVPIDSGRSGNSNLAPSPRTWVECPRQTQGEFGISLEGVLVTNAGFAGGFVSTLASNGSSVTPPALEFLGPPEHVADGTNRLSVVALGSTGGAYLAARLVSSARAKVWVYRFLIVVVVLSINYLLMVDSTQFLQNA